MKLAYFKDSIKMFKNNLIIYISIVLIIILGTGFFIGMNTISPAMEEDAEDYMKEKRIFDYSLSSSLGYTLEDIQKFNEVDNVTEVKGEFIYDALTNFNEIEDSDDIVVRFLSVHDEIDINKNDIFEGRNIEKENECLISSKLKDIYKYNIGDKIKVYRKDDTNIKDTLVYTEYEIVGIVRNPSYISKFYGNTTLLTGELKGYIMVKEEAFKLENYTSITIKSNIDENIKRFSDEYEKKCDEILKDIQILNTSIVENKYKKMYDENYLKIKEAESNLKKEENNLKNSYKSINDLQLNINNSLSNISLAVASHYNANNIYVRIKERENNIKNLYFNLYDLQEKQSNLESTCEQLKYNTSNLKQELEQIEKDIDKNLYKIYALNNEDLKFVELNKDTNKLYYEYNEKNKEYKIINEDYEKQLKELETIKESIKNIKNQINNLQNELYNSFNGLSDLIYGMNNKQIFEQIYILKEYINSINTNIKYIEEQKIEENIYDAKVEINNKKSELNNFKVISEITPLYENSGFKSLKTDLEKMKIMGRIFPVMFFVIAALVTITTMTRMIEEDRKNIGTLKALGYSKKTIILRYIFYSLSAGLLGGILGILLGSSIIVNVMFVSYSGLYDLPNLKFNINVSYSLIALLISLISTVFVTIVVTLKELKENSAELMRPKNVVIGKTILLERLTFIWKRLDFLFKVCFRNIFRYKKRLLMTIIGIAGCTVLIYGGLGLYSAINKVLAMQYKDIRKLYMEVYLQGDISDKEEIREIEEFIKNQNYIKDATAVYQKTFTIGKDDISKDIFYIVMPKEDADKYIELKNRKTGEKIELTDDGVVLGEKIADAFKVNVGDKIDIIKDGINTSVKVIGITENYVFNYMYFTPKMYERIFGESVKYNEIFVNTTEDLSKDQEEQLSDNIKNNNKIASISLQKDQEIELETSLQGLMSIVMLCIGCASILSFTVLINLNNINIEERKRELSTIKLLGFYQKELEKYIFRENIILTILGTLVGLILGIGVLGIIIQAAEVETIFLIKDINFINLIVSSIITIVFTLITNLLMKKKIKNINMIDSLKSVE